MFPFRCIRWFLHLRSVRGRPTAACLSTVRRPSLRLSLPLTTASLTCPPWPRAQLLPPACTRTPPPPPSPRPLKPWSSCWLVVTAATDTPPPPMQQRTPQPPPGETRPVARSPSAVCCPASLHHTSISSPPLLRMSVWRPGLRHTLLTSSALGASHSTLTYRGSYQLDFPKHTITKGQLNFRITDGHLLVCCFKLQGSISALAHLYALLEKKTWYYHILIFFPLNNILYPQPVLSN